MISTRSVMLPEGKPSLLVLKPTTLDDLSDSDAEDLLTAAPKSSSPSPRSNGSLPRHVATLCNAAEVTADALQKVPTAVVEAAADFAADVAESTPMMMIKALIAVTVLLSLYFEGMLQSSWAWSFAVAYVSANHFVYGAHHLLGASGFLRKNQQDYAIDLAGMGKILKGVESLGVWGFDEHRIADCVVHAGVLLLLPWRLDHWVELVAHVLKYGGIQVPYLESLVAGPVLTIGDCIDVFAHVVSGCYFLGFWNMMLAIAAAEALRLMIHFNVCSWSQKTCWLLSGL